jgi:methylamine---glutamate N-methyltransferase subunit A
MCGIAGIIHRDGNADVGSEMTRMLLAMKHRGPDSTGYALFGPESDFVVIRFKLADANDPRGFDFKERLDRHRQEVESRLHKIGASIDRVERETEYAYRAKVRYEGDLKALADYLEDVPGCEILSLGHSLEIVKDLGDAQEVSDLYKLGGFEGTHAIGHARMATESDVDISGAHPYWAYPFSDVAVVHNGQLTNYWQMRREFERRGHRFMSNCDSELLAVYTAYNLEHGATLEESLKQSIREIDGVFTYLIATKDSLGMAKDTMAAKPMVLYESDNLVALASEEVAIRAVIPREIDTWDPYDEEVRVWRA